MAHMFFFGGKVVDIINRVKTLVLLLVAFSACKPSGGHQKSATCLGFHGSCLATWGIHRAIHQRQRAKTSLQCPLCHLDQMGTKTIQNTSCTKLHGILMECWKAKRVMLGKKRAEELPPRFQTHILEYG